MALTEDQILRYSRQIIVPEVGGVGQERLLGRSLLAIGAGGLGSPSLLYLAAAGVGRIGVVDADAVDLTNLQRQIAHTTDDLGKNKAASAAETMRAINPDIEVITHEQRLTADNALEILGGYDVVIDGTDNFPTRYLINDACVLLGTPLVSAAILKFSGQIMTIVPGDGPCYRCVFPEPPPAGSVPNCSQAGILGPVAGALGSLQAIEALKLLLGVETTLKGRVFMLDALTLEARDLTISRNPRCPVCGEQPTITQLIDYEQSCGIARPGAA